MKHLSRLTVANLALTTVLAAVAMVLLLDPASEPTGSVQTRPVSHLDPALVAGVRLSLRDGGSVELSRRNDAWRIVSPVNLAAETDHVHAILGVLRAESTLGFRAAGNDLTLFGLQPPRAVMEVEGEVIAFGDAEPVDGRRYLLADEEVHVVAEEAFRFIERGVAGLASTSPLDGESTVDAISTPSFSVRLDGGRWTAASAAVDTSRSEGLAVDWQRIRAQRVSTWSSTTTAALRPIGSIDLLVGNPSRAIRYEAFEDDVQVLLLRPELGLAWHFTRNAGARLLGADRDP